MVSFRAIQEPADHTHHAQPDISKLKNGQLTGFTLDRLFSFLLRLNRDIEIRVTKGRKKFGKVTTVAA